MTPKRVIGSRTGGDVFIESLIAEPFKKFILFEIHTLTVGTQS